MSADTDMKRASLLVLAVLAASAASAAATALETIGAAAAVHGRVNAVAPGAPVGRVISSGKPLFLNDHVTSDAAGKLQVLLLDETVFTLGPNADMVLDEFVYDPKTSAGKVAAKITKGSFRFVTGKVARAQPENMTVKMRVGTIGIRGTVVVGDNMPDGSIAINAGAGPNNNADERPSAITLSNEGKSVSVTQVGEGAKAVPGGGVQGPFDLTKELDRISHVLSDTPTGKQASGKVSDPSKTSGQTTAAGKALAADELEQAAQGQDADQTQTSTVQQGFRTGISQWADLAGIQGTAKYLSPVMSVSCSGGGCSGAYTAQFEMDVNFNARTLGGGNSDIVLTGVNASDTGTIPVISFGTSGPAKADLSGTTASNLGSSYSGSGFTFVNQSGIPAAQGQLFLKYSDSTASTNVSGTLTAPRR